MGLGKGSQTIPNIERAEYECFIGYEKDMNNESK